MGKVYALLVGINEYDGYVNPLKGCVNDIIWLESYLKESCQEEPEILALANEKATREAVIKGFREHLAQARKDDTILFAFSGHGSQEPAPKEFWEIEPDRLNETLVCYDSRSKSSDIVDKEVSYLLSELSKNCPNITVILDCCHSGSGTRGLASVRQIPSSYKTRSINDYLFPHDTDFKKIGSSRHILFAACQPHQLAKECQVPNEDRTEINYRGVFMKFLEETLQSTNRTLTNREVYNKVNALVRANMYDQNPRIEDYSEDGDDIDREFLKGTLREPDRSMTVSYSHGDWFVNAGSIHGIPWDKAENAPEFWIFPFDADVNNLDTLIGKAKVVDLMPTKSKIQLLENVELDNNEVYKAAIYKIPAPLVAVRIVGDVDGVAKIKTAYEKRLKTGNQEPNYIKIVGENEVARFKIEAADNEYNIFRINDTRSLVSPLVEYTQEKAFDVLFYLDHIIRWELTRDLHNSKSQISENAIHAEIEIDGEWKPAYEHRFMYKFENDEWKRPGFRLRVTNRSKHRLFISFVSLFIDWSVASSLSTAGEWLNPNDVIYANDGDTIFQYIPNHYWQQGMIEAADIIKIIVSTSEFEPRFLEQPPIGNLRQMRGGLKQSSSILGYLLNQSIFRFHSTLPNEVDDWQTKQIRLTTVRPQEAVEVLENENASLTQDIIVQPHKHFKARMRLVTQGVNQSRSIHSSFPHLPEDCEPFDFRSIRGDSPSANVFELTNIQNHKSITSNDPLRIQFGELVDQNESMIAFVKDGEVWLPAGWNSKDENGNRILNIDWLPQPANDPDNTDKSILGSIKLYLFKMIGDYFGETVNLYQLSAVNITGDRLKFHEDIQAIRTSVKSASRIILFVHGIFGNSRDMFESFWDTTKEEGIQFDKEEYLFLTFNFENLNTPIEEVAQELKNKLSYIGVTDELNKKLVIVSNSMGGLICRYLVEHLNGKNFVKHLIMLGTPNIGSPWPTVHSMALTALTLGINKIAGPLWSSKVFKILTKSISRYDITLNQMKLNSNLLQLLRESNSPDIPYTIIAGNSQASESDLNKGNWWKKLSNRLSSKGVELSAAEWLFNEKENDIAVSVESMTSLPKSWDNIINVNKVECDHMTYFTNYDSLKTLHQSL